MQPGACKPVIRYVILLLAFNAVYYGFFVKIKFSYIDFVSFLSMIIYEVLYTRF